MRELRGANAILTGASRGLGIDIARSLAGEGVNLALAARSAPGLERVRSEVEDLGVRSVVVPTDVADSAARENLLAQAEAALGPVNILVNNAGIEETHRFESYPPDAIGRLIEVNVTAPLVLARLVLPGMLERGRGHIVNVASLAGKGGFPCLAPYSASKSALVTFTHALRAELVDTPVGCSVVCPGFVADAGMYADMVEATGIQAPRSMGTSSPRAVADAVLKAIRRDAAELIVNPRPMRPLLAMSQMFPDASAGLLKRLGVTAKARRMADALENRTP